MGLKVMKLVVAPLGLLSLMLGMLVIGSVDSSSQESNEPDAIGIHKVEGAEWHPERAEPLFIAILGSDIRRGDPGGPGGRCDAVHILAINPKEKAGTILNFPRDSYLPIPGAGSRKITEACFLRGTNGFDLLVAALAAHTGIPIQYYVTTEFTHFMALIDDLGGIEVDVPYAMNDPASGARFAAGVTHMSGGHALAFNRNRKGTPRGDFSRTDNQGLFILASHRKFLSEVKGDPHRLFAFLAAARKHTKITVPIHELVELGVLARSIPNDAIRNVSVPGGTGSVGTSSVVFLSPGDTYQRVRDDAIY